MVVMVAVAARARARTGHHLAGGGYSKCVHWPTYVEQLCDHYGLERSNVSLPQLTSSNNEMAFTTIHICFDSRLEIFVDSSSGQYYENACNIFRSFCQPSGDDKDVNLALPLGLGLGLGLPIIALAAWYTYRRRRATTTSDMVQPFL